MPVKQLTTWREAIAVLELEISARQEDLERAMAKCWPVGTEVRFRIQSNHVRPSEGVVRAHQGRFGQVVIRMASGHVARVSPSQILT